MNRGALVAWAALVALGCECTPVLRPGTSAVSLPAELFLGTPWVGDTVRAEVVVRATGDAQVRVASLSLAGSADLEVAEPPVGARIPAGSALPIRLVWTPLQGDAVEATLELELVHSREELVDRRQVRLRGSPRVPPDCDDENPCTANRFDRAAERCVSENVDVACDDGSACTTADHCVEGRCRGVARVCDDDDPCTLDLCNPASGCSFPPDPVICDDGDPCTANVCHRVKGCAFPPAPDGTACGRMTCAAVNVCVSGACRTIDVSGSSDGYPCSDGDRCTEGDTCASGRCVPGERRPRPPEETLRIPVVGFERDSMAWDGRRLGLLGPVRFTIADVEGETLRTVADVELPAELRSPEVRSRSVVALAPGRFALLVNSRLAIVDATNARAPFVAWMESFKERTSCEGLGRTRGGLVGYCPRFDYSDSRWRNEVVYRPVSGDGVPGPPRTLIEPQGSAVLADGDTVVVSTWDVHWMQLSPEGTITHALSLPRAGEVRLRGSNLLFLDKASSTLRLLRFRSDSFSVASCDPEGPDSASCVRAQPVCAGQPVPQHAQRACSPTARCPAGFECAPLRRAPSAGCPADAPACCTRAEEGICVDRLPYEERWFTVRSVTPSDAALTDEHVYWASDDGLFRIRLSEFGEGAPYERIHARSVWGLEVLGGDLIAYDGEEGFRPYRVRGDAAPRGLSGMGFGAFGRVIDTAERSRFLVGSTSTIALVDTAEGSFAAWRSLDRDEYRWARALDGATRKVPTYSHFSAPAEEAACEAMLVALSTTDGDTTIPVCGMGGRTGRFTLTEVAGTREHLWQIARSEESTSRLRVWRLPSSEHAPLAEIPLRPGDWQVVRAAGSGEGLLLASAPVNSSNSLATLDFFSDAAPGSPRGRIELVLDRLHAPMAVSGNDVLLSRREAVELHSFVPGETVREPQARAALPRREGTLSAVPSGLWMSHGRAWATWQSWPEPAVLVRLRYDAKAGILEDVGALPLDVELRELFDAGDEVVAVSADGVHVIEPGCP